MIGPMCYINGGNHNIRDSCTNYNYYDGYIAGYAATKNLIFLDKNLRFLSRNIKFFVFAIRH